MTNLFLFAEHPKQSWSYQCHICSNKEENEWVGKKEKLLELQKNNWRFCGSIYTSGDGEIGSSFCYRIHNFGKIQVHNVQCILQHIETSLWKYWADRYRHRYYIILIVDEILMNVKFWNITICQLPNSTFSDSYIFAVESDDINADLTALSETMDFSTYDENHPLFNDDHKSELGRYGARLVLSFSLSLVLSKIMIVSI